MKKHVKQLSIGLSSAVAALFLFLACGPFFEPENGRYRFFSPDISHAYQYRPFFFSVHSLYDTDLKSDNQHDFDSVNIAEWRQYFEGRITGFDMEYILYHAGITEIDSVLRYLDSPSFDLQKRSTYYSLINTTDKQKSKEALGYLLFAKECEPFACDKPTWPEFNKPVVSDSSKLNILSRSGMEAAAQTSDSFLRERYIFQAIRLHFFNKKYEACFKCYNDNVRYLKTNGTMRFRAAGYAAGALKKLNRIAEANYLYSWIYDNCPPMKVTAFLSFAPQEEKDWHTTFELAVNNRERAVLWQLFGLKYDEMAALQEIYRVDPKSDLMDALLVRIISKAENYSLPERNALYETTPAFTPQKNTYTNEAQSVIRNIADERQTAKLHLWDLACGYLDFLQGNYHDAHKYLDKASSEQADDALFQDQVRLIKIGVFIEEIWNPKDYERELGTELSWLRAKAPKYADAFETMPYGAVYQWALKRLSEKYSFLGDWAKAECLHYFSDTSFYASDQLIETLKAYMKRDGKTCFDSCALAAYPFTYDNLCEYQGIKLFYQERLSEALEKFGEGKESYTAAYAERRPDDPLSSVLYSGSSCRDILPADPFYCTIIDNHMRDASDRSARHYSKYAFVKRMIELQDKIKAGDGDIAELYYELANGFYNATYYGNARAFYETSIWMYPSWENSFTGNEPFMHCTRALKYYRLAMESSNDPEMKAKCCFMAAKCEQNEFYTSGSKKIYALDQSGYQGGEYFQQLQDKYSQTDYYQECIKDCGYFRKYLANQKTNNKN